MAWQYRTIGSYTLGYYEYKEWEGFTSPRSDLLKPPFAYNRWLDYRYNRVAHLGYRMRVSRSPDVEYSPFTASDWDLGMTTSISSVKPGSEYSALANLVDKWKDSDVNVGVSAAEGKESIGMIYSSLLSLTQSARQLRRGNLGGALRHLKGPVPRKSRRKAQKALNQGDVSGSWLALNLGWVPMIQDIYAASQFITQLEPQSSVIRSKWVKGTVSVLDRPGKENRKLDTRTRYVAEIPDPPSLPQRLGLYNPALIAWELVPFSFVIDYFLPIGDVLASVELLSAGVARMFKESRTEVVTRYPPIKKGQKVMDNNLWALENKPETFHRFVSYTRVLTTPASALINARMGYSLPTSLKRLSNMTALFHQQLLSMRK